MFLKDLRFMVDIWLFLSYPFYDLLLKCVIVPPKLLVYLICVVLKLDGCLIGFCEVNYFKMIKRLSSPYSLSEICFDH